MNTFSSLFNGSTVAHAIFILSLAAVSGLAIGQIRFGVIKFGVAGVIFSSIALSHFGFTVDHEILEFCRELGLMLFVYLTGMQVGPAFFSSFKKHGIKLNIFTVIIILIGNFTAIIIAKAFLLKDQFPLAVGLLSGATTNTPSLGAAHQALVEKGLQNMSSLISVGYAIAYPFGVFGIILSLLFLKYVLRIDLPKESELFNLTWFSKKETLKQRQLIVSNNNIAGKPLGKILTFTTPRVVVSRILKKGTLQLANADTIVENGDILLAVGSNQGLDSFQALVGQLFSEDLTDYPSEIDSRLCLVTSQRVLGKTLGEFDLWDNYNVTATRVIRAGIELVAGDNIRLQFGDTLRLVGEPDYLENAAKELGDSRKELNEPRLIPMFVGLAFGIFLGNIPFNVPGIPVPIKLGLAGGPLLAAIMFSRIGRIGPMIWHMNDSANRTLREFGIVLFLACVGLKAGEGFVATLTEGNGLYYMLYGAMITLLPLLITGLITRLFFKQNFLALCGLLSGSMTDPPALAFATSFTNSQGPAIAYATVYPLAMICRIISTQVLILLFM